jgi:hypothetical protein
MLWKKVRLRIPDAYHVAVLVVLPLGLYLRHTTGIVYVHKGDQDTRHA